MGNRLMKGTGIKWIGQIPEDWEIRRGKTLYSIQTGKLDANAENPEGEYPFFTCSMFPKKIDKYAFDCEALLVAGNGLVGFTQYYKGKFNAYQRTYVLTDFKDVEPRYLKHYVTNLLSTAVEPDSVGSVISFIKLSDLQNFHIAMPNINKQKEITKFLDKKCAEIDELITDIQSEIYTLEEYKKSVITEVITKGLNSSVKMQTTNYQYWSKIPENWEIKDIKYIFEIVKRIAGKEGFDILSVTQQGLKIKDISNNEGQIASDYSKYQFVYPTDYVMNHMDLLTGWVDCSTMFGVTSPDYRVFRLKNKELHNLDYFKYVLQSCYFNRIFYSLGAGVSNLGRWRLQTEAFNNFLFPVPPKKEQDEIAEYLNKKCVEIDEILEDKKAQLETLAEYKKSLIYEYVTGKKEVPTESDEENNYELNSILLGAIINKLSEYQTGRIQLQKILYLACVHLGLNRNAQYYRYNHGPYDIKLNEYIYFLTKNRWFDEKKEKSALLIPGKKNADFLNKHKEQIESYNDKIVDLLNLLYRMNSLKRSRLERITTLYAVWNDFLLDGVNPTDDEIIEEVITNWTDNKNNFQYSTWQDSLNKMKKYGLIPKGVGLHTISKSQKEALDDYE